MLCWQVLQSFAYLLEKGANCDVVPVELPFVAHDRTWSEAFEHKIMQQEGRSVTLGHVTNEVGPNVLSTECSGGFLQCNPNPAATF